MPTPYKSDWHPILAAVETEPGHWDMLEAPIPHDTNPPRKYGDIRLVRHQGQVRYRALVLPPRATEPVHLGYFPALRLAVEAIHRVWLTTGRAPKHEGYPHRYPQA